MTSAHCNVKEWSIFLLPELFVLTCFYALLARIRCNQFLLRKNERIACRLPALLPVTYANYVSTESRVCYNTAYARLLLLYDSVSVLHGIYPYVMCTSHFFSVYSAYSRVIYTVLCLFAVIHGRKSCSELSRDFLRMFAFPDIACPSLFRLQLDKLFYSVSLKVFQKLSNDDKNKRSIYIYSLVHIYVMQVFKLNFFLTNACRKSLIISYLGLKYSEERLCLYA